MGRLKKVVEGLPTGYLLVSKAADAMGMTRAGLIRAVREGRVASYWEDPTNARVYVDPEAAAIELRDNNSGGAGGNQLRGKVRGKKDAEAPAPDSGTKSLLTLRARKLEIENAKAMHELRRTTGLTVDKAVVEAKLYTMGQEFRMKLQQLPANVVDDVMAAKTRNEAIIVMEDAVFAILEELAHAIEKGI